MFHPCSDFGWSMRLDNISFPRVLAPEGVAEAIAISLARERGTGADLVAADDYCTIPQGYLLNHRVLFPEPTPVGREDILTRVERMIHAPRNPQVIETILKAASREGRGATGAGSKTESSERHPLITSLPLLAAQLASAQVVQPEFVSLLLSGDLYGASKLLPERGWPELPRPRALQLLCDVAVLWALHDLQVMAARLHQSIYQPTGLFARDEPVRTHVTTICASVKELRRALGVARAALARNHRPMNANEFGEWKWFTGFVEKHDLENWARTRAKEAGLAVDLDGEYASCPQAMRKIRDLLTHLERNLGRPIGDAFEAAEVTKIRTPAMAARWRHVRQKERRLQKSAKAPAKAPPKKPLARMSVSQLQHGMEPTIALAYAIVLFVMRIDKIERVIDDCKIPPVSSQSAGIAAALTHAQVRTVDALLTAYRAAILRDVGHLQDAADTPRPAMEAVGSVLCAKAPLLPPTGKPLTVKDATHGRGVSLEDKLPGCDPFSYAPGHAATKARFKRPGRPAIEAARAMIEQEPLNPDFDLSLGWRLEAPVSRLSAALQQHPKVTASS